MFKSLPQQTFRVHCLPGTGLAHHRAQGQHRAHFTDEGREAERGKVGGPRVHGGRGGSQDPPAYGLAGAEGPAETRKRQVIAADILLSPRPWPLALSLTFNQVPVMSAPPWGRASPASLRQMVLI